MTSIQSIETGENELAALPSNGRVAFFLTEHLENIENYIKVIKKNSSTKPNLAAYLYSQSGRIEEDYIPDFSVVYNSATRKVDIKFLDLTPLEEYIIVINTSFSVGTVTPVISSGLGVFNIKNAWLNDVDIQSINIKVLSDSIFLSGYNKYQTSIRIKSQNPALEEIVSIDSNDIFMWNGISIGVNNEPFIQNDEFNIGFVKNTESFNTIQFKTANIDYSSDEIFKSSRRANELDLISFYENETLNNTPASNTTKVKRILKSMSSLIVEFEEDVDLQNATVSASIMPAFNMLSLPEVDWINAPLKVSVRKISSKMILINFSESEDGTMEIVKNV